MSFYLRPQLHYWILAACLIAVALICHRPAGVQSPPAVPSPPFAQKERPVKPEALRGLVGGAVGFHAERGDEIYVHVK